MAQIENNLTNEADYRKKLNNDFINMANAYYRGLSDRELDEALEANPNNRQARQEKLLRTTKNVAKAGVNTVAGSVGSSVGNYAQNALAATAQNPLSANVQQVAAIEENAAAGMNAAKAEQNQIANQAPEQKTGQIQAAAINQAARSGAQALTSALGAGAASQKAYQDAMSKAPDYASTYQGQQQRSDTARKQAVEYGKQAAGARVAAETDRSRATELNTATQQNELMNMRKEQVNRGPEVQSTDSQVIAPQEEANTEDTQEQDIYAKIDAYASSKPPANYASQEQQSQWYAEERQKLLQGLTSEDKKEIYDNLIKTKDAEWQKANGLLLNELKVSDSTKKNIIRTLAHLSQGWRY